MLSTVHDPMPAIASAKTPIAIAFSIRPKDVSGVLGGGRRIEPQFGHLTRLSVREWPQFGQVTLGSIRALSSTESRR